MAVSELDLNKPTGQINRTSWKISDTAMPLISKPSKEWDEKLLIPCFTGHPFHLVSKTALMSQISRHPLANDLTIANDNSPAWIRFVPRRHVLTNIGSFIQSLL